MKAKSIKCPTCKGPVAQRADNPDFPFCSQRCKAVDLAKWFTGSYAVPGPPVRSDDDLDS
jgi:endogenous inhibitor of DNA gyrase (YacG/DUF329 family)